MELREKLVKLAIKIFEWSQKNPKSSTVIFLWLFYIIGKWINIRILKKPKSLTKQVILITGGANGLGRLFALKCKQKYRAKVIIWDINEEWISAIKDHVDDAMVCDVTKRDMVFNCAKKVLQQFKHVDILINNAGVVSGKPISLLSEQQVRKTFDVNIIAHFWTIQAFLPSMLEKKSGHIVTIASSAGCVGVSHLTDYCASKFAARGFDQALRRELIDLGYSDIIKQTIINPYFINTGMFDGATASKTNLVAFFTGSEFLEADQVCNETIDAIRYEKREVILPYRMAKVFTLEHMLPYWLQDWMIVKACDMKNFKGRLAHHHPPNNRITTNEPAQPITG